VYEGLCWCAYQVSIFPRVTDPRNRSGINTGIFWLPCRELFATSDPAQTYEHFTHRLAE